MATTNVRDENEIKLGREHSQQIKWIDYLYLNKLEISGQFILIGIENFSLTGDILKSKQK